MAASKQPGLGYLPSGSSVKTLLFDLDGTLTDPKEGIVGSIRYALEKLQLVTSKSDQDYLWCIGPPLMESFVQMTGSEDKAARALVFYRERFSKTGLFENQVYREIPETLLILKNAGHRLYVATSKPHVFAQQILDHFRLSDLFERVYGSELDGTRADKSELLSFLIGREALDRQNCIMIGDRKHDVMGARNNLVSSIGVLYGYGSRQELEEAGADRLCGNPSDLLDVIAQVEK